MLLNSTKLKHMLCEKSIELIEELEHALAASKAHASISCYRDAANAKIELRQHVNECPPCESAYRVPLGSRRP